MNALEIVHLRSSGEPIETLGERIRESIEAETDVGVHIRHVKPRRGNGQSTLALRLASALRAFGLVEHTVWEEMTAEN
jgi:hypothetical protein